MWKSSTSWYQEMCPINPLNKLLNYVENILEVEPRLEEVQGRVLPTLLGQQELVGSQKLN